MTYDRMYTYLTWGGNIGSAGEDTWQTGVHLALDPSLDGPGLPTTGELTTLLTGPLSAFHSAAGVVIAAGCTLTWAKCASMDDTGHYTGEAVYRTQTAVAGGATAGAPRGAPQVAMVITLWSGQTLGHANYGRMYMPWWEAPCADSGHVLSGSVTAAADAALTLVLAINTWASASLSGTAAITIMSKLDTGYSKRPTVVRVGDVKDTQQRRRRQLSEAYTTVAL